MASLVLAVFTIVATFVSHAFWSVPAKSAFIQELLFFKNIAVIGGLFAFFVACSQSQKWSVDGFRQKIVKIHSNAMTPEISLRNNVNKRSDLSFSYFEDNLLSL